MKINVNFKYKNKEYGRAYSLLCFGDSIVGYAIKRKVKELKGGTMKAKKMKKKTAKKPAKKK